MRPPHLDNPVKCPGFFHENGMQLAHRFKQFLNGGEGRDMDGCWERVVRRLSHIDVGIRADHEIVPFRSAQKLDRPIGNHFVRIHVQRSACSSLNRIDNKLIVPLPFNNFLCRLNDSLPDARIQLFDFHIGGGGGFLHHPHRANQFGMNFITGDRKILHCPQRLNAIVSLNRNLPGAQKIFF